MLTSDPHLKLFFSLFLRLVHLLSPYFTCRKPHLYKCPLCDKYPSHKLFFQHPLGGGGDSLFLSLFRSCHTVSVCVHHSCLYSSFSLAPFLFSLPLCPFPSFPCPFSLTLLHDCMCTRRSLLISLCVCMDALGGWAALPLTCLRSQH